jgi:hypothetical protein
MSHLCERLAHFGDDERWQLSCDAVLSSPAAVSLLSVQQHKYGMVIQLVGFYLAR